MAGGLEPPNSTLGSVRANMWCVSMCCLCSNRSIKYLSPVAEAEKYFLDVANIFHYCLPFFGGAIYDVDWLRIERE